VGIGFCFAPIFQPGLRHTSVLTIAGESIDSGAAARALDTWVHA
jgi:hypothetical protein